MFSAWTRESGVSRRPRTSRRRSFRQTSAARCRRPRDVPCAIAASVPAEHGRTAIPRVRNEPEEIGASTALSAWRTTFARVARVEARGVDERFDGRDARVDLVARHEERARRDDDVKARRRPGEAAEERAARGGRGARRSRPKMPRMRWGAGFPPRVLSLPRIVLRRQIRGSVSPVTPRSCGVGKDLAGWESVRRADGSLTGARCRSRRGAHLLLEEFPGHERLARIARTGHGPVRCVRARR